MKKFFAIAIMAVATLTANAQVFIGGELGVNSTSYDPSNTTQTNFNFDPEVGYNFNENWALGIKLGYGYSESTTTATIDLPVVGEHSTTTSHSTNSFSVNPYVRWSFVHVGNFSAFLDGGFKYATSHVNGDDYNTNTFSVGINPGIAYNLTKAVKLTAHLGDLSYTHKQYNESKANKFNLSVTDAVSFGVEIEL